MCDQIKRSGHFALQFGESTDVSGEAILLGFVRCVKADKIVEDLFCYCSMPDHTTREATFNAIDEKMKKYGLLWENVIGACTEGAPSMVGSRQGLVTRMAEKANENFKTTHCVIHREALAAKEISKPLSQTLKNAVGNINSIKTNPLYSRLLAAICDEMGSDHQRLLYHTGVGCLVEESFRACLSCWTNSKFSRLKTEKVTGIYSSY